MNLLRKLFVKKFDGIHSFSLKKDNGPSIEERKKEKTKEHRRGGVEWKCLQWIKTRSNQANKSYIWLN